jgi:membrane protein YdbS with pleckstrin-like domain
VDSIYLLRRVPLFQNVSAEYLSLIAQLAEWHEAAPGTRLTYQAGLGAALFFIEEGECVIRRVDERGMQRPVGMLKSGDSFGVAALFLGERRDAAVIALTGVRYWTIHRDDFQELLADEPQLERQLNIPPDIRERLRAPRYPWLEHGETVVYHTHRHWISFARAIGLATLGMGVYLALLLFLARYISFPWLLLIAPAIVIYSLIALWHLVDWRNDYFAVTTYRVTHRERVALIYESRREAPLDRVQNIHIQRLLLGRLLGYGDLTIQTAADVGRIYFHTVPKPEVMRETIWAQINRAQSMRQAIERYRIHEALASRLNIEEEIPPLEIAPGEEAPPGLTEIPAAPVVTPGLFSRALIWLARSGLVPPSRIERQDQVIWRKHWLFLLIHTLPSLLMVLFFGTLTLLGFWGTPGPLVQRIPHFASVSLLLTIIGMGWMWWELTDWGNDQYILTEERIIDIERRPLFFSERRRDASLGMIQNVSLQMPNFIAAVFNYGNVLVQTAGAGDFTFDRVANPRAVQAEIFQRMQAYREAQLEREASRRRAELAEWFSVYTDLVHPMESPIHGEGEEQPEQDAGEIP